MIMIPRETRQCPIVGSEPVGVEEVCAKCDWYKPDPRATRPCRYFAVTSAHAERYIDEMKRILGRSQ